MFVSDLMLTHLQALV